MSHSLYPRFVALPFSGSRTGTVSKTSSAFIKFPEYSVARHDESPFSVSKDSWNIRYLLEPIHLSSCSLVTSKVSIKFSDIATYSASIFNLLAMFSSIYSRGTTTALYTVNSICRDANGIAIVIRRPSYNVKTSNSRRDSNYARKSSFGMANLRWLSDFSYDSSSTFKNCSEDSSGSRDIGRYFESKEGKAFKMFIWNA